jgi:putative protease
MTREEVELLAPAGSRESLAAALKAGADAVYFGAGNLNMRARSSAAFGAGDLAGIAAAAADAGARSYLTLNVVLYDDDLPEMRRLMDAAAAAGVSAVIASDVAALEYAGASAWRRIYRPRRTSPTWKPSGSTPGGPTRSSWPGN